jgi:hypothetical protein
MRRNIGGILDTLEFVHTMSADMIPADIVWTYKNWFTDLKTYNETNSKNCNTY